MHIARKTDSYKVSHWKFIPEDTTNIYSYFESRLGGVFSEVPFFGLEYLLNEHFAGDVLSFPMILDAKYYHKAHFGRSDVFNEAGFLKLLQKHQGKLPVSIKAVPEGTVVKNGNVLFTIENTDDEFAWLTNWLETILVQLWYPCTVAAQSREIRKTILEFLEKNGTPESIDFKCQDFGYRGSTSCESAGIGGAAHLLSFKGTDTLAGIDLILSNYTSDIYPAPNQEKFISRRLDGEGFNFNVEAYEKELEEYYAKNMPGFSIPATEHSSMTLFGQENEIEACMNALDAFPDGLVACVSDSWDIINCCKEIWGNKLKSKILSRNGTLVARPDSGTLPGSVIDTIRALESGFGAAKNDKGYKVMPEVIRAIQGDGMEFIERNTFREILQALDEEGYSSDNLGFGSGGGLLQKVNRDTNRFALKCSSAVVGGVQRDVFKSPASDPSKNSKRGRLALVVKDGELVTVPESEASHSNNMLKEVFRDGEVLINYTFNEIRERVIA